LAVSQLVEEETGLPHTPYSSSEDGMGVLDWLCGRCQVPAQDAMKLVHDFLADIFDEEVIFFDCDDTPWLPGCSTCSRKFHVHCLPFEFVKELIIQNTIFTCPSCTEYL
jgi:8-oxo-dGTP pyrophosphatase MutT (NUDIX family)